MILCECGEFIESCTFKVYIDTSSGPSTATIGHRKCGLILDFVDGRMPKRYSTKLELKTIAMKYARMRGMGDECIPRFLIEVDRVKSEGRLPDGGVLSIAWQRASRD